VLSAISRSDIGAYWLFVGHDRRSLQKRNFPDAHFFQDDAVISLKRSKFQGPQLTQIEIKDEVFQALIVAVFAPTTTNIPPRRAPKVKFQYRSICYGPTSPMD
jgi:hypothetical protein